MKARRDPENGSTSIWKSLGNVFPNPEEGCLYLLEKRKRKKKKKNAFLLFFSFLFFLVFVFNLLSLSFTFPRKFALYRRTPSVFCFSLSVSLSFFRPGTDLSSRISLSSFGSAFFGTHPHSTPTAPICFLLLVSFACLPLLAHSI